MGGTIMAAGGAAPCWYGSQYPGGGCAYRTAHFCSFWRSRTYTDVTNVRDHRKHADRRMVIQSVKQATMGTKIIIAYIIFDGNILWL